MQCVKILNEKYYCQTHLFTFEDMEWILASAF